VFRILILSVNLAKWRNRTEVTEFRTKRHYRFCITRNGSKCRVRLCLKISYIFPLFSYMQAYIKKEKSGPATYHGGALGERRYSSYSFLTSALEGVEWSASRPGRALPPGYLYIGGWVGPRAGLDAEVRGKILCLCRESNPGRPVRSQTLILLSYPGSCRPILSWTLFNIEVSRPIKVHI
jgi:hypothetical protein